MPSTSIAELKEKIGTSYRTVEDLDIEVGKVREFTTAIGDDNQVYHDTDAARAAGFDRIPAPVTITKLSFFPHYRNEEFRDIDTDIEVPDEAPFELGFAPERTVHAGQEYEFERPVYAGDTLTGISTLTDVFQKEGSEGRSLTFFVIDTEYFDEDDELVVTATATRVESSEPLQAGDYDE